MFFWEMHSRSPAGAAQPQPTAAVATGRTHFTQEPSAHDRRVPYSISASIRKFF